MGFWYVVQYYASSEEAAEYSCMRSVFGMNNNQVCRKEKYDTHSYIPFSKFILKVTMNFTYTYENDPLKDRLQGNLTWTIPNFNVPSHWVHKEDFCKFSYALQK